MNFKYRVGTKSGPRVEGGGDCWWHGQDAKGEGWYYLEIVGRFRHMGKNYYACLFDGDDDGPDRGQGPAMFGASKHLDISLGFGSYIQIVP